MLFARINVLVGMIFVSYFFFFFTQTLMTEDRVTSWRREIEIQDDFNSGKFR